MTAARQAAAVIRKNFCFDEILQSNLTKRMSAESEGLKKHYLFHSIYSKVWPSKRLVYFLICFDRMFYQLDLKVAPHKLVRICWYFADSENSTRAHSTILICHTREQHGIQLDFNSFKIQLTHWDTKWCYFMVFTLGSCHLLIKTNYWR